MKKIKNNIVHFIGIGGISMSGLAIYLHKNGYNVQGSDKNYSSNLKELQKKGIKIFIGHKYQNIANASICIYTSAIDDNNPELVFAKKHCKLIERSELLGKICKKFKKTIAVSGTHGKTTTTAMIAQILLVANANPTVHIGGNFVPIGGNFRIGSDNFMVTEACEYKRSFLHINPEYLVINNVELDHLDYYNNLQEIEQAFITLANQTKNSIVINGDTPFLKTLIESNSSNQNKCITFGEMKHCQYRMVNLRKNNEIYTFDIEHNKNYLTSIKMKISGKYNALNALASVALCDNLSIPIDIIKKAIEAFSGVERRLEIIKKTNNLTIIKDYAHHPTEIKNVLHNIKNQNYENFVVIFQPHTYTRTLGLFDDFLSAFDECDSLIFLPTYSARELEILGGRSEDLYLALAQRKKNIYFAENFSIAKRLLKKYTSKNTCILLLGAGDIEHLFDK